MSPRVSPRVPEPTLLACQPTRVPLATARKPTCRPAASLMAVPHSCLSPLATNQPALAYTRLLSPTLACHRARVSRHSRVPACHGHASHASACIHMHRMHPHVSTCPTRVPSVRPPSRHEASEIQVHPHPVTKLPGSNIRPVHMPSGPVSRIVAHPTQHPHPNRCVRPAAPPSNSPTSVRSSLHRTHAAPSAPPSTRHISPWSPLRLDVSAPTFPSYFSSGFFPFSIYYRSRADPGFLPDLSIGVVHGSLSHGAMRFPRLCPFLSISLSVLLPLPSSGLSPAPRLST